MQKIFLVNMPFAALNAPSIPLTQLKSVLDGQFKGQVSVEVLYLNLDFAHYIGVPLYQYIALGVESLGSGVGEWFFRQLAFPGLDDNEQEYFSRYYPHPGKLVQVLKHAIQRKRKAAGGYLDELIAKYDLDQVAIVGFTSMFAQNLACFAMARQLKERNPDIVTVMGGANCESPMGQEIVRHVPQIDFVFSGPALKSFPQFVQHRLDQNLEACNHINGVFSKENVASFSDQAALDETTRLGVLGEELDINANVKLDYGPFLEVFRKGFPNTELKPVLLFETSRGCWWGERSQCSFCGMSRATIKHRAMSPEKAIEHLKSLYEYAPHFAYLGCVDNVMPKNYVDEVLPHLNTPSDVAIFYELKVPVSEREIWALSKAGVKIVQPGIEALTTPALKLMRKGTTAFQNLLCLRYCLMHSVYPVWNYLVGLPGEEEEMYEKYLHDIPLLLHLPPPTGVQVIRFDRYSPYFVDARRYGLDLHPSDFYKLVYPLDEEVLRNLAYHFTNRNFNAPYLATVCKWSNRIREECGIWWARWYGQDRADPPKLFFKHAEGCAVVYDSRSGDAVEHLLEQPAMEVLKYLEKPRTWAGLESLGHSQGLDPARELGLLQDDGLVFEEDGSFMSLVLPAEPPPPGAQALEYLSSFTDFLANFSSVTL
jgi:ribosomal peptide maturation radical SAM protein 1